MIETPKKCAERVKVVFERTIRELIRKRERQRNTSLNLEIVTRLNASIELDRLLKINNANEALAALTKLKRWLVDFRVLDEGEK